VTTAALHAELVTAGILPGIATWLAPMAMEQPTAWHRWSLLIVHAKALTPMEIRTVLERCGLQPRAQRR
jgi:hypothetical protein